MTDITLRDYQVEILERSTEAEARGIRRQLIVAATGLGKTVVFTTMARRRGTRTLILAHRDELIAQAVAKVLEVWPDLGITQAVATVLMQQGRRDLLERHSVAAHADAVGIVKAGADDVRARIVVASVQTLSRSQRLAALVATWSETGMFGRCDPIGLVIVDEAHHAAADTYGRVLTAVGVGDTAAEGGPLLVGVTATPERADGKGLVGIFDEIVSAHDMLFGIAGGYLSDLRALRVKVAGFDVAAMRKNRGDFDQGQAGRMLDEAGAPAVIVKAWQQHAAGRPTIVFTPTVAVAHHTSETFARAGINAAAIDAQTPDDDRRRVLAGLKSGAITVVCNCGVLTEGFDEPRVSCIVVARPTRSTGLYVQMIGRGTRRHPEKDDCLVLDIVGASDDKDLVTLPSLYGIAGRTHRAHMGDGSTKLSDAVLADRTEQARIGAIEATEIEVFHKVRRDGIAWIRSIDPRWPDRTQFRRPLGKDRETVVLALRSEDGDTWNAGLLLPDGTKTILIHDVPLEMAQGIAEDYVRKNASSRALVSADAPWRKKKPSSRAKAAAVKWHLKVDPKWTAGDLADALDAHIAGIKARNDRKAKARAR